MSGLRIFIHFGALRKSGILARLPGQGCPGYEFSFMVVRFGAW
jgi:hypothetical protein